MSATLENFPMVSQLDSDPNAQFDCVAGSIAAALQWLNGRRYTASEVKDAVYGRSYVGDTDPANYVGYCASQGVKLAPINGTGVALVQDIRDALDNQFPVLITEPDPYMPGTSETHVCVAYACDDTSITVMDPYIARPVTKTDHLWAAQLQYNQIWTLQSKDQRNTAHILQLTDPWGQYFQQTATSPTRWHCAKTGHDIIGAILAFYRRIGGAPRLPVSGEKYDVPNVVYQEFESGILVYDPQKVLDAPGVSFEPVYMLKLGTPLAQKLLASSPYVV